MRKNNPATSSQNFSGFGLLPSPEILQKYEFANGDFLRDRQVVSMNKYPRHSTRLRSPPGGLMLVRQTF
jgi:hypothetical protein